MDIPALVIMSRVPSPKGKSRLSEILKPEQRESLQWAFLLDTLDKVMHVQKAKHFVAATPADQVRVLRKAINPHVEVIPQPDGNLGKRMLDITRQVSNLGYSPVILIGTDIPALPPAYLFEAIESLARNQLVLGPALDGGYYLIGMQYPEERVFEDIVWSSDKVLEKTIDICKQCSLTYRLLEPLRDVDHPADLLALAGQIEKGAIDPASVPVRTVKFMKGNLPLKG